MIKIGCCTAIPTEVQTEKQVAFLAEAGYDYVEYNVQSAAALSYGERKQAASFTRQSGLACCAMNCFLPGNIRIVGPDADPGAAKQYMDRAFPAAAEFGTQLIVFGSGGARRTPAGFPKEIARLQLIGFLRLAAVYAAEYGIKIAVEPLCRAECNTLNTLMDGYRLVQDTGREEIRLLADYYHFSRNGENPLDLISAAPLLAHVHTATVLRRGFPTAADRAEQDTLFSALKTAGYAGGVSIEGGTMDFAADAAVSIKILRELGR